MPVSPKDFLVSCVITLMVAPNSINVLLKSVFLIFTLTTGLSGLEYLVVRTPPIIMYDSFPMT